MNTVEHYGYERTETGIVCTSCKTTFSGPPDGSVMRGHARRCPVNPVHHPIPGVCAS